MRVFGSAVLVCAALLVSGSLFADDPTPANPPAKHGPRLGTGGLDFLHGLDLTAEQKTKLGGIMKEYGPKFKESAEKMGAIYTDEQKQAIRDAVKSARAAGKSPKETREAVEAALKPTPEQQTKLDEIKKDMEGVQKEIKEKVMALLTPEQKEMVEKKIKEREEGSKKPDSSK